MQTRFLVLFFLFVFPFGECLKAQNLNTGFGKNRVQFHNDFKNWWSYETENFIVYWYGKGRNVAKTVIQMAEMDHDEIQGIMEHRFNNKIEIVVYLDVTDMKQTNIGSEGVFENKTGQTKIVGNKMFVSFDGNHQNLRTKIREGVATVYLNSMLFGSNLQEIVQNAVLLNVPDWYKQGLVAYIGSYWDFEKEDELRDILERDERYWDFEKLSTDFPEIAGHSLWYYIDQNYGKSSISNILYLTRINRNLENSFLYVLGNYFDTTIEEWRSFYKQYYADETQAFTESRENLPIKLSNKDYQPISQIKVSPDGKQLIYVYNDLGKYWIKLRDLESEKEKTLFKYGYKNGFQEPDYNYPLVAWHPSKNEISFVYEDRDVIKLKKMNLDSGEKDQQIIPDVFQRIYSIDYWTDKDYIYSAAVDGFSDLFLYKSKTRESEAITEDFYDDLDARVVEINGDRGILFSSNRPDNILYEQQLDTILPISKFDVFFYNFDKNDKRLNRLTFTPNINERQAILGKDNSISFLNYSFGLKNHFAKDFSSEDNGQAKSNVHRNIILHETVPSIDTYFYMAYANGAYSLFADNSTVRSVNPYTTPIGKFYSPTPIVIEERAVEKEDVEELLDGYLFQSEFEDPANLEEIEDSKRRKNVLGSNISIDPTFSDENKIVQPFNSARAVSARKRFRLDNFTTKMDNDILFNGLESYAGEDKSLNQNPLGVLLKANVLDLFEDHSIEGGVRIPTTFNGSEYFLVYENRKKRIDQTFALYRRSQLQNLDETQTPVQRTKRLSYIALFQAKYPFDLYRSLRLTTSLRFDRLFYQSSDAISFNQPVEDEKRVSLRAEYIFDSSRELDINILQGTRYKIYGEAINRFNLKVVDGFDFKLSSGFTSVLGYDARHYINFGKFSVLALRSAGAFSMGSEKMLYYLGGVENWLFPSFDDNIPVNNDASFSYKVLAPQMRGFKNNARNGGSYLLGNIELRVPIFKHLFSRQISSSFLRNFQVVLFYDLGTAWYGLTPYSDENPLNSLTLDDTDVVQVTVKYFRDPLIMGFGPGIRSSLFGYFVKLDYAWGLETRNLLDPMLYFSFGKDF